MHAVLVTDDQARPIVEVDERMLAEWVEQASAVFAPAGLRFVCDYPADVSVVNSTALLNQAAVAAGAATRLEESRDPERDLILLDEVARRHPGRIVCFVAIVPRRWMSSTEYELEFKAGELITIGGKSIRLPFPLRARIRYDIRWVQGFAEFAQMKREPRFVVMANLAGADLASCDRDHTFASRHGLVLAHELGHALGLKHTFARRFRGIEQAREHFVGAGSKAEVFDGDGLGDTAPDPGIEAARCDPAGQPIQVGATRFESSGNIMSYTIRFSRDGPELSPRQIAIVRESVRSLGLDARRLPAPALDDLIRRQPDHPEARYLRGRSRLLAGKYAEAGRDFAMALAVRPSWHEALVLDGLAALARFEIVRARDSLEAAVLARPGSAVALAASTGVRRAMGEPEAASADLGAAKSGNEYEGETWDGTEILAKRALWREGMTPDHALGAVCAGIGAAALADRIRERLAAQEAGWSAAAAAEARGDPAGARAGCARLLAANPLHWMAWQLEGNLAHAAGKRGRAIEAWRTSLRLHPDNPGLRTFVDGIDPAGRAGAGR